ncbi:MAG: hypothetical protein JXA77_14495 [Bacteroidales bacterium]|nr:hypothetical protein [Bacteroidales bacterium]MBN2818820.1 hypothetical protein [Bacteroidales bacterium]
MNTQETRLFKNWWLLCLKGIIISIFGLVILFNLLNYKKLVQAFIIISMVNGALILFGSFYYKKNNQHWLYWLIEGTFDFLLGLAGFIFLMAISVLKYHIVYAFLIQIIALWALIHGIIHTISANKVKNYVPKARIALFSGIGIIVLSLALLIIVLSLIVVVKPIFFMMPDYYFSGGLCIIIGILLSTISIIMRKIYSE